MPLHLVLTVDLAGSKLSPCLARGVKKQNGSWEQAEPKEKPMQGWQMAANKARICSNSSALGSGQAARLTLEEELDLVHPVFSLCWAWRCELERGSPVTVLVLGCRKKKKIEARIGHGDPGSAILYPVTSGKPFRCFFSLFQTGKLQQN